MTTAHENFKAELADILGCRNPKYAINRAVRMGIAPDCTRCGGSGHYSFNRRDGTVCFKCRGWRQQDPSNAKQRRETLSAAREAVADGRLETYLERARNAARARKAEDKAMAAWKATGIGAMYAWMISATAKKLINKGVEVSPFLQKHSDISDINKIMCDAYDAVSAFARSAPRTGPESIDAQIELAKVLDEAIATIEAAGKQAAARFAIGPATSKDDRE